MSLSPSKPSKSIAVVIAAVLLLLVVARTLDSILTPAPPSPDLTNIATMLLHEKNPSLFSKDYLFYSRDLYASYIPLYRWILDKLWQMSGSFENALIWTVPILTTIYLVGVYLLLWQVTQNIWISLGLTVANATIYATLGDTHWGMSDTTTMGARSFFMAVTPYLALLFFYILLKPRWYKGFVFGLLVGLFMAFHPVSGFHFLVIMFVWSILVIGKTMAGWQTLISIIPGVMLTGWPVAWNIVSNVNKTVGNNVSFEIFSEIVRERREMPFFPAILNWPLFNLTLERPFLDVLVWFYTGMVLFLVFAFIYSIRRNPDFIKWIWLTGSLITVFYAYLTAQFNTPFMFAAIAIYLTYRCLNRSLSQLDKWLVMLMGLIILHAFVSYYFITYFWQQFELWSFTSIQLEFNRSARFIYLPTFLLVGLAGVELVRKLNSHPFFRKYGTETTYSIAGGLVLATVTSASQPFATSLGLTILVTVGLVSIMTGLVLALNRLLPDFILPYVALALFSVILFGPLADYVADYTPVPAKNLFRPENLLLQPTYTETDTELYNWVRENTPDDVLFWVCDISTVKRTLFRFNAQRSISHNWKDVPFHIRYRASLVSAQERYNILETACEENYSYMVQTAQDIKADYLLITPSLANYYLSQACFSNEAYAIFTLNPNGCP